MLGKNDLFFHFSFFSDAQWFFKQNICSIFKQQQINFQMPSIQCSDVYSGNVQIFDNSGLWFWYDEMFLIVFHFEHLFLIIGTFVKINKSFECVNVLFEISSVDSYGVWMDHQRRRKKSLSNAVWPH